MNDPYCTQTYVLPGNRKAPVPKTFFKVTGLKKDFDMLTVSLTVLLLSSEKLFDRTPPGDL